MRVKYFLYVIASILIFTGCLDDNSPPVYENVEGVVIINGDPISDASVHIRNHFEPGGFIENGESQDEALITFQVESRDLITGNLYLNGGGEAIATFFQDTLSEGVQTISIPDSLLVNGVLAYEIRSTSQQLLSSLFVVNKADSSLPGTLPFTYTDSNGEFILDIQGLSIGQSFSTARGGRFSITDSLQLIITQGDEVVTDKKVRVKPDQSNYFEITVD